MQNIQSLKRLLKTLNELKATMRDTTEPGVSEILDEAISQIQDLIDSNQSDRTAKDKALSILGKTFEKLPSIAALINLLSG